MPPRSKKPTSTEAMKMAVKAKAADVPAVSDVALADDGKKGETITTAIHIPKATWELLRRVAFKRAMEKGGRPSVSALLAELAERHRDELEDEAKR